MQIILSIDPKRFGEASRTQINLCATERHDPARNFHRVSDAERNKHIVETAEEVGASENPEDFEYAFKKAARTMNKCSGSRATQSSPMKSPGLGSKYIIYSLCLGMGNVSSRAFGIEAATAAILSAISFSCRVCRFSAARYLRLASRLQ